MDLLARLGILKARSAPSRPDGQHRLRRIHPSSGSIIGGLGATLGQSGEEGILCSYAIGDKADDLAASGTEDLCSFSERDLACLFPEARTKAIAIERYAWQADKFTQGSYALYRPGQWFPVRQVLGTPHQYVYFAGEHLADEQGFMDGAIDSGEGAAEAVMRHYRKQRSAVTVKKILAPRSTGTRGSHEWKLLRVE